MANSVRLLNYLDVQGDYLRFYTELDSGLSVGDKVFIIGGNYDNTIYTDKDHISYNPFHQYATGYTVISIDNTTTSNAISLNIKASDSIFSSGGITSAIFASKDVYKTEKELLLEPNQPREAYISKTYFKRGEFNGGKFVDGVFGEYNIKGYTSSKTYQRQHMVDLLRYQATTEQDIDTVSKINNYDYSTLESPSINNQAIFNNNFTTEPAQWTGGVFLGGEFQFGKWSSKYESTQQGKFQDLNDSYGIKNILNNSQYNIQSFSDNNKGVGYNIFVSGNWGRIYSGEHNIIFDTVNNEIELNYIPYPLRQAHLNGFNVQVKINSPLNNRVLSVDVNLDTRVLTVKPIQTYKLSDLTDYTISQQLFAESGTFTLEVYIEHKEEKPLSFDTGRVFSADWFGGIFNGRFEGGDWHWGEFNKGTITSLYQQANWNHGIFNGSIDESFAQDLNWNNGFWLNGNWQGANNVPILGISYDVAGLIKLTVHNKFKHLFTLNKDVFLSYFKKGSNNQYLDNFTDSESKILNFQTFRLIDILSENTKSHTVTFILSGEIDSSILSDINLQEARISQSHFTKGLWNNGVWETGLREVNNKSIIGFNSSNFLSNAKITLYLNESNNLQLGDLVEITNFNVVREIEISYLPDSNNDDRLNQNYLQSIDLTLTVSNITNSNGTSFVEVSFPTDATSGEILLPQITSNIGEYLDAPIIGIQLIDTQDGMTELASALWIQGEFRSGAWRNGVWRNGTINSILTFNSLNNQIQSVWQSGYWKNGSWNNAIFLSGLYQNGIWSNGIMTNGYNSQKENNSIGWTKGDSVWLNGTFLDGEWRRGLLKKGTISKGLIQNGGFKELNWTGGQYTNGFNLFDSTLNLNKSGRFIEGKNTYSDLSAPSLIYLDANGWIQLDQPSHYQKNYNIIFQDVDINGANPYQNQMFSIINRDQYGTRLQITNSTSGDNPLASTYKLPLLAIDHLVDLTEVESDDTNHIVWLVDANQKRILTVDLLTGEVDVLGKVIGDSTKDIFNFTNLKLIEGGNSWVYVIDNNTLKLISLAKDVVLTQEIGLALGENIIDSWLASNNDAEADNETIFLLSDRGIIYYWRPTWTGFKKINSNIPNVVSFTGARTSNSNRVHLFVNSINTISVLTHLVLDYSLSDKVYSNTSSESINVLFKGDVQTNLTVNKLLQIVVSPIAGKFNIWLLTSDYNNINNQNIYFTTYDYNNSILDESVRLNIQSLDYSVSRLKLGWNAEYLTLVGKKDGVHQIYFGSASTTKNEIGLGNPNTEVKLYDIFQTNNSSSGNSYKYWVYDDAIKSKRVLYLDESNPNLYDSDKVDVIGLDTDVKKLIPSEYYNKVYSITQIGTQYVIRSSEISGEIKISSASFNKIYDAVFVLDRLFIIADSGTGVNLFTINSDTLDIQQSILLPTALSGSDFRIDGIEDNSDLVLAIWAKDSTEKIYQVRIDSSNVLTIFNIELDGLQDVKDIALSKTTNYFNKGAFLHLYIATNSGISMLLSDKFVSGHYTWTLQNIDNVFVSTNIDEIYRTANFNQIVVRSNNTFELFDVQYTSIDTTLQEATIYSISGTNFTIGISNETIIKALDSTSGLDTFTNLQGIFNQVSRLNKFSQTASNSDKILTKPSSIIFAEAYNGTDNFIFFIDNNISTDLNSIRSINLTSGATKVEYSTRRFLDITYCLDNKTIYCLTKNSNNTAEYVSYFNNSTTLTDYNTLNLISYDYNKLSVVKDGTTIYIATLKSNTTSNIGLITITGSVSHSSVYSTNSYIHDISMLINSASTDNKYQIHYVNSSNILNLLSTDSISNPWVIKSLGLNVVKLNEKRDTNELVLLNENNTLSIVSTDGDYSEELLSIKDLAFTSYDSNVNNIFFRNVPTIGSKGIIRELMVDSATELNLNLTSQLDDISTGTFIKMMALNNDKVYALFSDGIYEYNFTTGIVSLMNNPDIVYRNSADLTPSNANLNYYYKAVDLGIMGSTVVGLFEIIDNTLGTNIASKHYDVFALSGNQFITSTSLDYLYYRLNSFNDSINISGDANNEIYPSTETGGIQYLFKSYLEPKIFFKNFDGLKSTYLYFKDEISGTPKFLKVVSDPQIDILQSSIFGNLVFKLTITDYKESTDTPIKAYLTPDPTGATSGLVSTSFYTVSDGSYNGITILQGEIIVEFTKPTGVVYEFEEVNITISFDVDNATSPSSYSTVYDFRVFEDVASQENVILIRESIADDPIVSGKNNILLTPQVEGWTLSSVATGQWELLNVDGVDGFIINSLIKANNSATIIFDTNETNNNANNLDLVDIPLLDNSYNFNTWGKGFKVINTLGTQVLSPYITGRVLSNTIINNDVSFNANGNIYSGHVVSTKWKNGLFVGSWDAPFYNDHNVIDKYSIFINGIFEGNFYDGFFIGGTFRSKGSVYSELHQGHFMSDANNINWLSGKVKSDYRYDVQTVRWENNKLKVLVQGLINDNGSYTPTPINQIVVGSLIQIPTLFKNNEYKIHQIQRGKISIDGKDEITLIVDKPLFYNEEFWVGNKIFISSNEHSEYLFGENLVQYSYIDDNYLYLVIRSNFNKFDSNGVYNPVIAPKVIVGLFHRVITKIDLEDGTSELTFDLPIPSSVSMLNTLPERLRMVQKYYLQENIDIMSVGNYQGYVVIPNYLQLFTFTFQKTYKNLTLNLNSKATNLYLNNINSDDNSSYVSVNLGTHIPGLLASDIMVNNSYLTSSNPKDYIETSIFLSGKTDRTWVSGAWLNLDSKGFSNGNSVFGSSTINNTFEGKPVKIIDYSFESLDFIWIQLDDAIDNVDRFHYITLRGFTGSKSTLIGANRSKVFRIQEVDNNWIKIKNPFKYYLGVNTASSSLYLKDFNANQLRVQTQSMLIKDLATAATSLGIETPNKSFLFEYGFASVSCWNGGEFYGDFESVWNGGKFLGGNLNGQWFGSSEYPSWRGFIDVEVQDNSSNFIITLRNIQGVAEHDYVYVKFNDSFVDNTLVKVFDGFYANVIQDGTNGLVIKHTSTTFIDEGEYPVSITRYRTEYQDETDPSIITNNILITDYNTNVETGDDVNKDLWMDTNLGATSGKVVISFGGANSIATTNVIKNAFENGSSGELSIDFYFKYTVNSLNPIMGFIDSKTSEKLGFKIYIQNNQLHIDYNSDGVSITKTLSGETFTTNTWNHVGLFINNGVLKYRLNTYDSATSSTNINISDWDLFNDGISYDLNLLGQSLFFIDNNINSLYLNGALDEVRFWNQDMYDYFQSPYSFESKRFLNSYLPQIVAYFTGEGQVLNKEKYFPKEELFFVFDNISTKVDTLSYNKVSNAVYEVEFLANKELNAPIFKILTIEEARISGLNYFIEIFGVNNSYGTSGNANTFSLKIKECISRPSGIVTDTSKYYNIPCEIEYFKWQNMIITENGIYIDGKVIPNSVMGDIIKNRNIFKHTISTRISLGDSSYLSGKYTTDANLFISGIAPTYFKGFIKNVNIFDNKNTKNEYIIYRIISPEDINNFTVYDAGTNTIISDINSKTNFQIPNFNSDGSIDWVHHIYTTENYYKASTTGAVINYTKSLQDADALIPSEYFDSNLNFIRTDLLSNAMPEPTWMQGTDFFTIGLPLRDDGSSVFTATNMQNFLLFGKNFANSSGNVDITVSTNAILTLTKDPVVDSYIAAYSYNDLGDNRYPNISSIDMIYMLFSDIFLNNTNPYSGSWEYADRENELIIRFYAPYFENRNSSTIHKHANFNYFALRLDKINSTILFYNRRIKPHSNQKIQGLRRSDTTWNYVNDENRVSYYKYNSITTTNDFVIGYDPALTDSINTPDASNANVKTVNKNTEYVLCIPRNERYDDMIFIPNIIAKNYYHLESSLNVSIVKSYNGTELNTIPYSYVVDSSAPNLTDYIVTSDILSGGYETVNGTNFATYTYSFSEQFDPSQGHEQVARESFFMNGNFNSSIWYNGIMVNGNFTATNGTAPYIWKYGLKYNGNLSSSTPVSLASSLHWLGGFNLGTSALSNAYNIIWYRGYYNGGNWFKGHWMSLDLSNLYVDGSTINNDWSVWDSGIWYSLNSKLARTTIESTTNEYALNIQDSNWHGGTWNSPIIEGYNYTYQNSQDSQFFTVYGGKQIELPSVSSIWLGGQWLRGIFNGGIFVNGFWHSLNTTTTGLTTTYETKVKYGYDETYSVWNGGMMLNSIWEGGTVTDMGDMLDTIFGNITNYEVLNIGDDFAWDNTKFTFRQDTSLYESYLGRKAINPTKLFTITNTSLSASVSRDRVRVLNQFNNDGIMSVYWKRGKFGNGLMQFSYWENKNLNQTDINSISTTGNASTFFYGGFYSSYWKGGLWVNNASANTVNNLGVNSPNSFFYYSQWEKGYWKASGLSASSSGTVDSIEISDGIFSRSIWNAGVFEGGLFDLSVWRSGVSSATTITYNGTTSSLTPYAIGNFNYTFALPTGISVPTTFSNPETYSFTNDSTFLTTLESSGLRYVGAVDNMASIWVNGWMRGSVWHGGVWQRGMFSHRTLTNNTMADFFQDSENNKNEIGWWLRGIWLSGYFSYYNDKNVIGQSSTYGTEASYLDNTNGTRSIFLGLKAINYASSSDWNNKSIFGISKDKVDVEISSTNLTTNNHNYASILGRNMIKDGTKKYFTIFNGTMINGTIFDKSNSTSFNRMIVSIYATIGKYYYKAGNTLDDINLNNIITKLTRDVKITPNSEALRYNIVYNNSVSPIYYNGSSWSRVDDTSTTTTNLLKIYNGNFVLATNWNNSIWRHDNTVIGDTTTSNLPSIAQGIGYKWNPTQPNGGEPNYFNEGLSQP